MTSTELKILKKKAWEDAKSFIETHQKDGLLTEEDQKTYDSMEKKIKDYDKAIDMAEKLEDEGRKLNALQREPLTGKPSGNKNEPKTGRASEEYLAGALQALRTKFTQISAALQEGVDSDGGYLVPEEWDRRLIESLEEENVVRKLGTTITTSGTHKINIAASKPAAAWIDEGEELTFGDATFSQILLDAHKLHVAVKVTEELLYDNAYNLEDWITRKFADALANAEENAFLNGSGTGEPLGIFAEEGGGTAAVSTTKISADDIITLVYSLKRPYRKNAKFIMNDSTIAAIRKLKDNNGAYLWQPALVAGEPDRLFGYEVYTSAYAPEEKIAFGDFSYYNIGDRGTRSFKRLDELFAGNGLVGFVAKERVDGKLVLAEAVQILTVG